MNYYYVLTYQNYFDDAGGSWLVFGILVLIWIWSLILDTLVINILAVYSEFEGAKSIHVY